VLHAGVLVLLNFRATLPALDFELVRPDPIELGIVEEDTGSPGPEAADPPEPPLPTAPSPELLAPAAPAHNPAQPPPAAKREPAAAAEPPGPLLASYAPAGAQLALRLHLGKLRESELAPDVKAFLEAVPDWRAILEGSELDPITDLERLYLASPDLRRSRLVIAGQYRGSEAVPRLAVSRLAAARGQPANWRKRSGVEIASWNNADATPRVLALIGPRQFVITRTDDLPRVLQVARALALARRRATSAGRHPSSATGADRAGAADALLGLEEGETLAVSVDQAPRFVRGNAQHVPEHLEAAVDEGEGRRYRIRVAGDFKDEASATSARAYWEQLRARYAYHPLVALMGIRPALAELSITRKGTRLSATTSVTTAQARLVLGLIRGAIAPAPLDSAPRQRRP
jgi:hypothetical protein